MFQWARNVSRFYIAHARSSPFAPSPLSNSRDFVPGFLLFSLAVLWGCGVKVPNTAGTFTDDLGRKVTWEGRVERVVPLAPNLTEILFAAGAGDRVAGVSISDNYPRAVEQLPHFSTLPLNFEAIAALDPSLVLATDQVNSTRDAKTFAALSIPTIFFSFRTLSDVPRVLRATGAIFGTESIASRAANDFEGRLERLLSATDTLTTRPRVLFLIGEKTLFSFGKGSYIQTLIDLAGGTSITSEIENDAPVLSDEFVLVARPNVIVGTFDKDFNLSRLLEYHPTWRIIPAIEAGLVFRLDPDLFLRPGPRLADGAYLLAKTLHPALMDTLLRAVSP